MKGMKGMLFKKLKSMKPIGYVKQDRILQVNATDGVVETVPKMLPFQAQTHYSACKEAAAQENYQEASRAVEEEEEEEEEEKPDLIDVTDLMRDLEDEEEEEEMEVDDAFSDKENIRPPAKAKDPIVGFGRNVEASVPTKMESESSSFRQAPLSEIDISSFRRPDLNSGSLFDPNLLAAFEQAVREHMGMREAERRVRIETRIQQENIEKKVEEARIEEAKLERAKQLGAERQDSIEDEENVAENDEPPLKTRRIDEDEHDDPLLAFQERCPPGGSDSVVLYTTSLRGIRKTFEDCSSIRFLLESFRVLFFERDVSMHMEFKEELWRVLDGKAMPPRLFIKGRHIGGADEVLGLHEQGKFRPLFRGLPLDHSIGPCEVCSGVRFVLCSNCSGSHRVIAENGLWSKCLNCNENGLIICPLCC